MDLFHIEMQERPAFQFAPFTFLALTITFSHYHFLSQDYSLQSNDQAGSFAISLVEL